RDDQSAHYHALNRQIIEDVRDIHEICEQKRDAHDQSAHQHDEAGPFQNVTEPPHGKAKKFAFLETQTANPGETNHDQVDLDVNAEEIFKDKRRGIDRGRKLK